MSGTIPFPNGGGGEPPERRSKMDLLIDELYVVLPSKSMKEIQQKLIPLGQEVSLAMIGQALFHLRKHAAQYGWSVPHVKRGPDPEERCYFPVLVDDQGSFIMDEKYRAYARQGFRGTLSLISNMGQNEVTALRIALKYIKSRIKRERLSDSLDDVEYAAKKVRLALRAVNSREDF
jgi:hypothetical protein